MALTLGIGFAAVNTGNNLLYLILGVLLTFIIGSGVLSEIAISQLKVSRITPKRTFANQAFLMSIVLQNPRNHLPSFSIDVEDMLSGKPLEKKCFFLKVPPGRTQKAAYRHHFVKRGAYSFTAFKIGTKFPFSLFHKSRREDKENQIIVYPEIHPVNISTYQFQDMGAHLFSGIGRRGDFYSLREYRDTDDPRDIHWRKSARLGKAMIRQYQPPIGKRVTICLDNGQEDKKTMSPTDPLEIDKQEQAISHAASLAVHFIRQGYGVGLLSQTTKILCGRGQNQLDKILRALALIQFIKSNESLILPQRRIGMGVPILVTTRGITATPKTNSDSGDNTQHPLDKQVA